MAIGAQFPIRLPGPGVFHRRPRLLRGQRFALLEQLDRDSVGRSDEGHVPVARGAVDRHPGGAQPLAGRVDILHPVGEMAEIAAAAVFFRVPVIGQLDRRRLVLTRAFLVAGSGQEHQRETTRLHFRTRNLDQAELAAEEIERFVEIAHPDHRVEVFHRRDSPLG